MRKFEVGDRVVVRDNFWLDSPSKYLNAVGVNPYMKTLAGQVAKIVSHYTSRELGERLYRIDLDNYAWASDWLHPANVEVKEGDAL